MSKIKSTYLALIAVLLSPMAANSDPIEVSSSVGDYSVTTIEGTVDVVLPTLMQQVWWGDLVLANEFADLVGVQLGTNVSTAEFGPFFATSINNGAVWNFPVGFATTYGGTEGLLDVFTWAVATQVPEPGTLALLGIGLLGMAVVRRRKLI